MPTSAPSHKIIVQSKAGALLDNHQYAEAAAAAQDELVAVRDAVLTDAAKWNPLLVHLLETLGLAQLKMDHLAESEVTLKEAIATAEESDTDRETVARLHTALCSVLDFQQKDDEVMQSYEKAIVALEAMEVPDLATAAQLRNNLALGYKRAGKLALAEQHYLRSVEALEGLLGKDSADVASLYNNLGSLYYTAGFSDQAKEMFSEGLAIRRRVLGDNHPDVAQSYCNLGTAHYQLGDNAEAMRCFEVSLNILESHLSERSSSYTAVGEDYIALLNAIGEERKANAFQRRMEKVLSAAVA